jgi:serine/threonine protein kinase
MQVLCDRCSGGYSADLGAAGRCPHCGFDPRGDAGRFGPYWLLAPLGRGGLAVVFKARRDDGDTVALKVLASTRKDLVAQFEREGSVAARLSHPNIVKIVDAGLVDGHRYIAFEYVQGPSFAAAIARRAFAPGDVARIGATVARALLHAHRKGIVHRDITPRNILLTAAGVPKLTDFGLAMTQDGAARPAAGVTAGTPIYMSPEQAAAMHDVVDARSDVYSLGAVLYEALAGRPPFGGPTVLEILRRVREEPPPPLEGIEPGLAAVVTRALDKDPARRFPSMKEFAEELQKWAT